jgi:ATP-binding cassette subfamily B protein
MKFSRGVRPLYDESKSLVDNVVLKLTENVQGIHVVKGFALQDQQQVEFTAANRAVREKQQRIFWGVSIYTPIVQLLSQINLVVLLVYGGYLVVEGDLPLGTGLVVFAGLLQQYSSQITSISNLANSLQQSLSAARRVFEVLDTPVDIQSAPRAIRLPTVRGEIRMEHVTFGYDAAFPILRDVSVSIPAGQCVALVGPAGAGKSSLMSLIPRFHDPQRGRVLVDGYDVRRLNLEDLRRGIGLVFQESFLFSQTIAANIAFGCSDASMDQIHEAARIACADEFISQLPDGYGTVLGEFGMSLSGGQRQRLAIARAILSNPPILLLDDPVAAIDSNTEQEILEAIQHAKLGRTTIIIAHRPSTLRFVDTVIVLKRGRIIPQGNPAGRTYVKAA